MNNQSDSDKITHFSMNVILHVIILFTFLSAFFFLFVSNIEKSTFENEIGNLIEDNMKNLIDTKPEIKQYLAEIKPYLLPITKLYDHPDRYTLERNILIKFSSIFVVIMLVGIFITILATVKFACGKNISSTDLVIENIIIFIFVGIIEYMFFTRIAIKYVPATPSLLVDTIINTLKNRI